VQRHTSTWTKAIIRLVLVAGLGIRGVAGAEDDPKARTDAGTTHGGSRDLPLAGTEPVKAEVPAEPRSEVPPRRTGTPQDMSPAVETGREKAWPPPPVSTGEVDPKPKK
jgi:hypothetical protein